MNAISLVFKSARFNLSEVSNKFINPCCFGEDLAQWLQGKLREKKLEVSDPYQEEWGWELPAANKSESYYLCMSGNADREHENPNEGEWRISIEKRRSVAQRFTGKGKIDLSDGMLLSLKEILESEPDIQHVRIEVI
jgi:hypothetical protein